MDITELSQYLWSFKPKFVKEHNNLKTGSDAKAVVS